MCGAGKSKSFPYRCDMLDNIDTPRVGLPVVLAVSAGPRAVSRIRCYVGKRHLEKCSALSFESGHFDEPGHGEFPTSGLPCKLEDAPKEGVNKIDMYNKKFGPQRVAQMVPYMTQVFAGLGINYSLGGKTGNTFDSHRLIAWAGKQGGQDAQDKVVDALFDAYFSKEKFLGDRQVLIDAAAKAGLDAEAAAKVVDDPSAMAAEVKQELASFGRDVTGVPFFIVGGTVKLSGAQPPEEMEKAIRRVIA